MGFFLLSFLDPPEAELAPKVARVELAVDLDADGRDAVCLATVLVAASDQASRVIAFMARMF